MLFIYGIIWGLLKLTIGSFLHAIHFPYKGLIMGSIGLAILAAYLLRHGHRLHPIFIAGIAACFKGFNVFIFTVPLCSPAIINPALAIVSEGLLVAGIATIVRFVVPGLATPPGRR